MGRIFVSESGDADVSSLDPVAHFALDGVYGYLEDGFKELHESTGQLIHPDGTAFFSGENLLELEQHLVSTFEPAVCQAVEWDQQVGTGPNGEALIQRTSRKDLVDFLRKLAGAVRTARDADAGVLFRA